MLKTTLRKYLTMAALSGLLAGCTIYIGGHGGGDDDDGPGRADAGYPSVDAGEEPPWNWGDVDAQPLPDARPPDASQVDSGGPNWPPVDAGIDARTVDASSVDASGC